MATSSVRTRAVLGGVFSLALVLAPIGIALSAAPAGAAQSKVVRPFLAQQPRVFPAPQTTFTVNSTGDGDVSPSNGAACDDGSGHCTLRAAVDAANNINQTVVINLPAGTYTVGSPLTVMNPSGTQILGTGNPVITSSAASSAIVAQQNAATNGAFLDLTNVTVANTNGGGTSGAGLSINDGNDAVTMTGTTFQGNSTTGDGGAIYNFGNLWATNSTFNSNSADEGGAIYNSQGSIRLSGDTFNSNSTTDNGGAIHNEDGPVAVDTSTFTGNFVATTGG